MSGETTEERTRVRLKRALDLCEAAAALPPTERESFLSSACGQDAELGLTVTELLRAQTEAEASGFMESPAWSYTPPDNDPRSLIGQRVGAYRLTQFLDHGGMGEVYLAERADGFFERQVAVKLIRAGLAHKEYRRFRREVRILAALQHPNLVFLYDAECWSDGRPYLVMEYVKGDNLQTWLERRRALPREQVVEITRQACAGLHAAHEAGVIHRDIKPANLIVSDDTGKLAVKVLDFGIAFPQRMAETEKDLTGGQVIGTVAYMSPDQLRGVRPEHLTAASDLYSLGLVVYEMITGQPAVTGNTQAEIIAKHLYQQPALPSQRRPDLDIPAEVDRVMMRVLNKDPLHRYQTAPEFAADLETAFRQPWISPDAQIDPQPEPPQPAQPEPPLPRGRSKAASALFVLAMVAAVGVGSYLAWPRDSAPTPPVEAAALSVDLLVQATPPRPFKDCNFALLKPEIKQMPAKIKDEDTLLVYSGIDDQRRLNRLKDTKLPPGEYLYKFTCVGFRSVTGKVQLQEDLQHLGRATVPVKIEPE
jgi:serine/threonine protein kinase